MKDTIKMRLEVLDHKGMCSKKYWITCLNWDLFPSFVMTSAEVGNPDSLEDSTTRAGTRALFVPAPPTAMTSVPWGHLLGWPTVSLLGIEVFPRTWDFPFKARMSQANWDELVTLSPLGYKKIDTVTLLLYLRWEERERQKDQRGMPPESGHL